MAKKKELYTGMYERTVIVKDYNTGKDVEKKIYDIQFQYKGVRIHKTSIESYDEAFQFYVSTRKKIESGEYVVLKRRNSSTRLCDLWEKRLNDQSAWLKPSSIDLYRSQAKIFENYDIWKMDIKVVRLSDLQIVFNDIGKSHTVYINQICKRIISQIYEYAIDDEIIYRSPVKKLKVTGNDMRSKFKGLEDEEKIITYDEFCGMVDYLQKLNSKNRDSYLFALYTGYYTGMRKSEILALTPGDYDFDKHTVSINKQVIRRNGKPVVDESLKTTGSHAVLPIPEIYENFVKSFISEHPTREFLCCRENLELFNPNGFSSLISDIFEGTGMDRFHMHMLRHTYITNLVASGADIKTVQALARHANISTTLDVYTHESLERKVNALHIAFGNTGDVNE